MNSLWMAVVLIVNLSVTQVGGTLSDSRYGAFGNGSSMFLTEEGCINYVEGEGKAEISYIMGTSPRYFGARIIITECHEFVLSKEGEEE